MIRMGKNSITQRDRKYYRYDNKIAIAYDSICTIDTMHFMVELSDNVIKYLLRTYRFSKETLTEGVTKYKIYSKGITVIVFCHIDGFDCRSMVQLYREITVNQIKSPLWDFIHSLLHNKAIKYYIRRIDVAFDYKMPISRSITLSRNTAMKRKQYETGVMIGSTKSSARTATISHYDRNSKEQAKKNATVKKNYEYPNRYEVKLFFKEVDGLSIYEINHELIKERLMKEIFVVDYKEVDTLTLEEKKLITSYKKKGNEQLFKGQRNLYNRIKGRLFKHRESLETIYQANQDNLYDFLTQDVTEVLDSAVNELERGMSVLIDALIAVEHAQQKNQAIFKVLSLLTTNLMYSNRSLHKARTIKLINCSAKKNVKLYLYLFKQKT